MLRSTLLLLSALLLSVRLGAAPAENPPSTEPPPEAAPPVAPAPPTALPVPAPTTVGTPENWAQTLERIASGVVTIQIDSTRAFDTEWNTTAQATGFVIDAKRGLILTNRHVVTPGSGHGAGHIPEPRGSAALPGVPRSRARLRYLSLRSDEAALHPAGGASSLSGGRRHRTRNSRGRQRCRRAAVDPRGDSRAPGSRGARNTATASTTTSTRSTTRRHRAPRAARRALP